MHTQFKTKGTCSTHIDFDIIDGRVHNVVFTRGCSGNTQGVAALIEGMEVNDAIRRIDGIKCGPRPTSCPDQLAQALKQAIAEQ